jgi:CheY-like chemotaxis protein
VTSRIVALVEKERPDLILVDLMMPGVDGFMACERSAVAGHRAVQRVGAGAGRGLNLTDRDVN